jgi:hypothetical protein
MSATQPHPVHPLAEELARPFLDELSGRFSERIQSIYLTGSAVTPDFHESSSDVNTLLVVREMSFEFLDEVAKMGTEYGKRRIRAPLLLTLEDIRRFVHVFPIETLDLKLVSHLVKGEEVLSNLQPDRAQMRLQCQRELWGRIVRLRQEYVHALSDPKLLSAGMVASVSGLIALLRGVLCALGRETPIERARVLAGLGEAVGRDAAPLEAVFSLKAAAASKGLLRRRAIRADERQLFKEYYAIMTKIAEAVDAPV